VSVAAMLAAASPIFGLHIGVSGVSTTQLVPPPLARLALGRPKRSPCARPTGDDLYLGIPATSKQAGRV